MTSRRRRSLSIPADDDGFLGRECPRCRGRFKIDITRYDDRGFMNLRCPYCRFVAELDTFTTGEQRGYINSTAQNFARQVAEQITEEAFSGLSGGSSSAIEIDIDTGDVDFGHVPTESPVFTTDIDHVSCDDCEFPYGVETGEDGVCPVCR